MDKKIEEKLQNLNFKNLSENERDALWNGVLTGVRRFETKKPIPSPWLLVKDKKMIPLIIGAMLFISAGGTVAASNNAVPGDVLFGLDRAVENIQLKFSGSKRAELEAKFAEERLKEVEEIAEKSKTGEKAEAKVELGVETAISFLNEVSTRTEVNENAEAKAVILDVIDRLEDLVNTDEVKVKIRGNQNLNLHAETEDGEVKVNTSGNKERIELRDDGERIRIELKEDGDIKIKTNSLPNLTASTTASSSMNLKLNLH